MSEDEEEIGQDDEELSARERWAQDDWTQKIAKVARTEVTTALRNLVKYCATTADPMAARLHAIYEAKKEIAGKFDNIEGKTAKGLP